MHYLAKKDNQREMKNGFPVFEWEPGVEIVDIGHLGSVVIRFLGLLSPRVLLVGRFAYVNFGLLFVMPPPLPHTHKINVWGGVEVWKVRG